MNDEQDYIRDITEMRSLMERSSKFMSLSGLASLAAGIYSLAGAFIVYSFFHFNPHQIIDDAVKSGSFSADLQNVMLTAFILLILAVGTALNFSFRKAVKRREKIWSPTAKRLVINMAVPLIAGGLLLIVLLFKGLIGLLAPLTLIFYGMALYNAGNLTYKEVKSLGFINIGLGLISACFVKYGLLCWSLGFGVSHIIYGIYIHYRYER